MPPCQELELLASPFQKSGMILFPRIIILNNYFEAESLLAQDIRSNQPLLGKAPSGRGDDKATPESLYPLH